MNAFELAMDLRRKSIGFTLFASLLLLLVLSADALAQSTRNPVSGAGASSCGQYLEASSVYDLSGLHVSWAQGFLSGLNVAHHAFTSEPMIALPDAPTIKAYIDKYCRENPLERPAAGVGQLFREIKERQKTAGSLEK